MATGRFTRRRKTASQALADERALQLAIALGRALREARLAAGLGQARAAVQAGIAQSTWSAMERGRAASFSWVVWMRATHAFGADLHAYLERTSAAGRPRDSVHLRYQELVARLAARGRWTVQPEADTGNGFADLVLGRRSGTTSEKALIEVWDWLADVGDAFRSWRRKLERLEAQTQAQEERRWRLSGVWVLRATRRNRSLLREHPALFRAQFPGSGAAWLASLGDPTHAMPSETALLWASVTGDRFWSARP
jgi:transcriptional regulator with XRE-family HTH domain